ncbi:hypothetical protein ACFVXQ_17740 [Kitasatospora sp. NPDC058263]
MAGYIEDRWLKKGPSKETGKRERTSIWGKCTRYRVKGIPGVRDRSFDTIADAKAWLAETQTDARRGDFVDARDGATSLREYVEKHWWPSQVYRVAAVRGGLPDRYRIALDLGVGCGLRQGEVFALSPDDIHDDFVRVERQVLRYGSQLYFGPPKGGKEREVPLTPALAKMLLSHQERCSPVECCRGWPDLARADRRKVTVPLLVHSTRRQAINRSTWDTKTWKPALAAAGVIPRSQNTGQTRSSPAYGSRAASTASISSVTPTPR